MRSDIQSQRNYFKEVLTATIKAAIEGTESSDFGRTMALFKRPEMNVETFKKICLEQCTYSVRFPRQIGKTTIVQECVAENQVILLSPEMVSWKDCHISPFFFDTFSNFIESELNRTKWVILIDSSCEDTNKLMDSTIESFINANNKNIDGEVVFPYFVIIE